MNAGAHSPASRPLGFSIALATCNGARYITEQLDSILAQTRQPAELVVFDDRSDDGTVEAVRAFAARAPFPVVVEVNAQRLGYRENFCRAARRCSGDIVMFCDQDDIWLPGKIARTAAAFADDGVLAVYHNADLLFEDGRTGGAVFDDRLQAWQIDPADPIPFQEVRGFTQAYRRILHDYDRLWPGSIDQGTEPVQPEAHDLWFLFLAVSLGRVVYLPDRLAHYRQHAQNVSGPTGAAQAQRHGELQKLIGAWRWNDAHLARCAARRGEILADIAQTGHPDHRGPAAARADRFRHLAAMLDSRATVTRGETRWSRLAALLRTCRLRGYGLSDPWALPARWLVSDLVWALRMRHG